MRTFLWSVVVCRAVAVLPQNAAAGDQSPHVIGLGREAIHKNLPVFLRHPLSQVVALCDVDRWRLEQQ